MPLITPYKNSQELVFMGAFPLSHTPRTQFGATQFGAAMVVRGSDKTRKEAHAAAETAAQQQGVALEVFSDLLYQNEDVYFTDTDAEHAAKNRTGIERLAESYRRRRDAVFLALSTDSPGEAPALPDAMNGIYRLASTNPYDRIFQAVSHSKKHHLGIRASVLHDHLTADRFDLARCRAQK